MPSQHDEGTVYVTQRGREDDDFAPYIYKSADYGKTFTSMAANVPAGPVNVIREDPADPNRLFIGTDFGAFVSGERRPRNGRCSAAICRRRRCPTCRSTRAIMSS